MNTLLAVVGGLLAVTACGFALLWAGVWGRVLALAGAMLALTAWQWWACPGVVGLVCLN